MSVNLPKIRLSGVLLKVHIILRAYLVKWFRTRYIMRQWRIAHAQELTQTPVFMMPMVMARQSAEIAAVRDGKLGSGVTAASPGITDRKSWQWPYLPASINRLAVPILKAVPYNLRRMSRTPVPRRAMNQIKGALISLPWELRAIPDVNVPDAEEQKDRIRIGTNCLKHPNNEDSFQTFLEQGMEDQLCLGAFVAEIGLTPDPERPIKMWPLNLESLRLFVSWQESTPDMPRYAQMTGMKGERGAILFYDDEILYLKDNQATDNPFGLGKMEIAFQSVNSLLGVQDMAGRAGADQVHKCFPEGTEVLTRRGWMQWRDTRDDDEFATRTLDGRFQWQHAIGFVREKHEGDLIQFSSRELRITVTPNHRMYGWKLGRKDGRRIAGSLGFVEARDLFDEAAEGADADFRIPVRTVWQDGVLPAPDVRIGSRTFRWKDWAAFLGIWIAEGSCLPAIVTPEGKREPRRGEYRVQIAQSKRANRVKYRQIDSLLGRMGLCYQRKADRFVFSDRDIWAYVSTMGNQHVRCVPQWLKDAPAGIIRVFVDWAMKGDGTTGPRGKRIYYTASKKLADDMQELFQKIGSSASVVPSQYKGRGLIYTVSEMLREEISIVPAFSRGRARMPKRIPYSGMVYCAMVPNGTLYCRENGYAFWSGNTWLWWEAPQTDSAYQIVRRHIQNELEGQAKISIIGGMKKPEVIDVQSVKEEDILLAWQEMLIRMIANAFDMSAMSLGVEHDVNRAVGQVLNDRDFRTAVVPAAKRLQEGLTRRILHNKLGWYDVEFVFLGLDDPDAETRIDIYSRMYAMNAITPNQICRGMNMPPLFNPYADLTQFECMLLNIQAMGMQQIQQQDTLADHSMKRQQQMMDSMPQQPEKPQGPPENPLKPGRYLNGPPQGDQIGPGQAQPGAKPQQSLMKVTPGTAARGGQPPSPRALSLPKFPVPGTMHSAAKIAQMPLNQMQDVFYASGMRTSGFLRAMDGQEPGVLQQLTDEVKEFLEQQLKREEQDKHIRPIPANILNRWKQDLAVRIGKSRRRSQNYTDYMYRRRDIDPLQPAGVSKPDKRRGRILPPVNRGL